MCHRASGVNLGMVRRFFEYMYLMLSRVLLSSQRNVAFGTMVLDIYDSLLLPFYLVSDHFRAAWLT
jgi:hypothetical protein